MEDARTWEPKDVDWEEVLPPEEALSIRDCVGKQVVILSCEEREGDYGIYYACLACIEGSKGQVCLNVSASRAMKQLDYLKSKGMFPFAATVGKMGNMIQFVQGKTDAE